MSISNKLHKLAAYEVNGSPVVSLYLNAQADNHGRDDFDRFVRKEFSTHEKSLAEGSPERESFLRVAKRINAYLKDSVDASANGIAIFAGEGSDDFFEAIHLDAPIDENILHVADRPFLYPLARVIDQYPSYVALVADTSQARIFVFGLGKTKATKEIENEKTGRDLSLDRSSGVEWTANKGNGNRTLAGERPQLRHQLRIDNYRMHFVKEVVDALKDTIREENAQHIVLAGDEVIIPLLRAHLPDDISAKVIDVLRLDINTPEHEVFRTTMVSLSENNLQDDAEKVRDLLDRYREGGLAAVGLRDTLYALSQGQADELLISSSLKEVRVDSEMLNSIPSVMAAPHTLSTHISEPRSSEAVADVLVEQAIKTGASVTFIEDPKILRDVGGVGALLRYRD